MIESISCRVLENDRIYYCVMKYVKHIACKHEIQARKILIPYCVLGVRAGNDQKTQLSTGLDSECVLIILPVGFYETCVLSNQCDNEHFQQFVHSNISVVQILFSATFAWMYHRIILTNTTWAQWVFQIAGIEKKVELCQITNDLSRVVPKIINHPSETYTELCQKNEVKAFMV